MAERRMFAKTIIDSDAFLDMPQSTQCLYFHLSMRADDDGFINNPKKIQRMVGASGDDIKLLIAKKFIIPFESGIVVIKHWKIHNYIRNDRYKETVYKEEKALLSLDENNSYTLGNGVGIPNGYQMDTQVRLGKDSIGKDSIEEDREDKVNKETFVSLIDEYTTDPLLVSTLKNYVEMRKKMKGFTTHALKINLNTLSKLTDDDATKVEIVNQSIEHSWKSFYELKHSVVKESKEKTLPSWYTEVEETGRNEKEDHLEKLRVHYEIYSKFGPEDKLENVKSLYKDLTGRNIEDDIEGEKNE